jgi:hypothetical protein
LTNSADADAAPFGDHLSGAYHRLMAARRDT